MNIDTTITIDTAPKIRGLALPVGLHHVQCGEVAALCFSKAVGKAPQTGKMPEALEAFYDAFELSRIEPGTTPR